MKLGVMSPVLNSMGLENAIKYLSSLGVQCMELGVDTIIGFSGCPGDCENSQKPNWVTCSWLNDFSEILDRQWNSVLIPYWKEKAAFCKAHGITKEHEDGLMSPKEGLEKAVAFLKELLIFENSGEMWWI